MKKETLYSLIAALTLAGQALAQTSQPLRTFLNPNASVSGNFGYVVASLDGDRILIGAPAEMDRGFRSGLVYLMNARTGDTLRVFHNPTPGTDNFGFAIAPAGNRVLIGAPTNDDARGDDVGAAYLFDVDTGQLLQTFTKPGARPGERFGYAVAVVGTGFAISAPFENSGNTLEAGAVYFFADINQTPLAILNPTPANFDRFGSSLAAINSTREIVVGTPSDGDANVTDAGAVYLYDTAGFLKETFVESPRVGGAGLGFAVGVLGNNVLAGAPFGRGRAYLFDTAAGGLLRGFANPTLGNGFGAAIASAGSNVIIGAPNHNRTGAVYIFEGAASGALLQTCLNPTLAASDSFGFAVAGINQNFLIGAPFDDNPTGNTGVAYLLETAPVLTVSPSMLAFNNAACGLGEKQSLKLRNTGTSVLVLTAVQLSTNFFTILKAPAPNTTLNPRDSLVLDIRFEARAVGAFTDNLQISSNATPLLATVALSGNAIDNTPPVIICPGPITAVATGPLGTLVSFNVTAVDACDPTPKIVHNTSTHGDIMSPHLFPIGTTLVTSTAMDAAGNRSSCDFNVIVTAVPRITLPSSPVDFDTLVCSGSATISTKPITIRNDGQAPLILKEVKLLQGVFTLVNLSLPDTILPNSELTLNVDFRQARLGAITDTLQIASNDPNRPVAFLKLIGHSVDRIPPLIISFPNTIKRCATNAMGAAVDSAMVRIDFIEYCDPKPVVVYRLEDGTIIPRFPHIFSPGNTKVTCTVTDASGNADTRDFNVQVSFVQGTITINSPVNGYETCDGSITVTGTVTHIGGIGLVERECFINGNPVLLSGDTFSGVVPIKDGFNTITVVCNFKDANLCEFSGTSASITIFKFPLQRKIVINELLSDPNYKDLGNERIEIKNTGAAPVKLDSLALWIRQNNRDTYWAFPKGIQLGTGDDSLLVIHWLEKGANDLGNIFTGLPADSGRSNNAQDGFWGNNSASTDSMTLGGPDNRNAFAMALVQRIVPGATAGFLESCRMVDFIQLAGRISIMDSLAEAALLWTRHDFIHLQKPNGVCVGQSEGVSYEFEGSSADLTSSNDFFHQSRPTLGFRNTGADPEPDHLVISEVCVQPTIGEFIEIFNPDSTTAISLANYYLTDNGNFASTSGTIRRNSYIDLTRGPQFLNVNDDDFYVRFPADATIGPRQYQTIAFRADRFVQRYGLKPTYEVITTDGSVKDMREVKLGKGAIGLGDSNDVVILLNWNGVDDLVKDVDYLVWGDIAKDTARVDSPVIGSGTELESDSRQNQTVATRFFKYISKTPAVPIDGLDLDVISSHFALEATNIKLGPTPPPIVLGLRTDQVQSQDPVNVVSHAFLKSWQRRPVPRELGEVCAGGNGITGHDETSERLGTSFREDTPTPNRGADGLDLEFDKSEITEIIVNGRRNKIVNPAEVISLKIRLRNLGDEPTGPLQSILRIVPSSAPFVRLEPDSTTDAFVPDSLATFFNINPNATALSNDNYVFASKLRVANLPDTIRFNLLVIQKTSGLQKTFELNMPPQAPSGFVPIPVKASNVDLDFDNIIPIFKTQPGDSGLVLRHRMRNYLSKFSGTARRIKAYFAPDNSEKLFSLIRPDTIRYGQLALHDSTALAFSFALSPTRIDTFKTPLTPRLVFGITWVEGVETKSRFDTLQWAPLPSYRIDGSIKTFGQTPRAIPGALVKLESADTIQTTPTNAEGMYTFDVRRPGIFKITVTRSGVPQGAITRDDSTLLQQARANINLLGLQARVAADLDSNGEIAEDDVEAMKGKLTNLCAPFESLGKDWTFIDAFTTLPSAQFFRAPNLIEVALLNYSFVRMDFTGVLYGDVRGDVNPEMTLVSGINCPQPKNLRGKVVYYKTNPAQADVPVRRTILKLEVGKFEAVTTDSTGAYAFLQIPSGYRYTVTPKKVGEIGAAINDDDLRLLRRALINSEAREMLSDLQKMAADVNQTGGFTPDDTTLLRKYVINAARTANEIGMTGQWRFRKKPNNDLPYNYDLLLADQINQDVVAIVLGDVNGSWTPLANNAMFSLQDGSSLDSTAQQVDAKKIPQEFFLSQNYPNPFLSGTISRHPATMIEYGLPRDERVQLRIFNVLGQIVHTAVDQRQEAGYYQIAWSGNDQNGRSLPSGVYLVRLEAGKFSQVRKLLLVR